MLGDNGIRQAEFGARRPQRSPIPRRGPGGRKPHRAQCARTAHCGGECAAKFGRRRPGTLQRSRRCAGHRPGDHSPLRAAFNGRRPAVHLRRVRAQGRNSADRARGHPYLARPRRSRDRPSRRSCRRNGHRQPAGSGASLARPQASGGTIKLMELRDGQTALPIIGDDPAAATTCHSRTGRSATAAIAARVGIAHQRITTADRLLLLLPLLMWIAAAIITWSLVSRLLVRPAAAARSAR